MIDVIAYVRKDGDGLGIRVVKLEEFKSKKKWKYKNIKKKMSKSSSVIRCQKAI